MKNILKNCEKKITNFIIRYHNVMPEPWIKWIAYYYPNAKVRKIYWKHLGVVMGEGTYSNIGMIATRGKKGKVLIGKNVSIAPYVTFVVDSSPNNGVELPKIPYVKNYLIKDETIRVEDEVWIGANAVILSGVRVGKCSIIGAGSVVTKDVEPYCIYAGVPAKKIRELKNEIGG